MIMSNYNYWAQICQLITLLLYYEKFEIFLKRGCRSIIIYLYTMSFPSSIDTTYLKENISAIVSSDDTLKTHPCDSQCTIWPLWTFNTSSNLRIKIIFRKIEFDDADGYLKIDALLKDGGRHNNGASRRDQLTE